jgi:hypothetical protein
VRGKACGGRLRQRACCKGRSCPLPNPPPRCGRGGLSRLSPSPAWRGKQTTPTRTARCYRSFCPGA